MILGFPPKKGWGLEESGDCIPFQKHGVTQGGSPGGSWAGKSGVQEEIWTRGPGVQVERGGNCFHLPSTFTFLLLLYKTPIHSRVWGSDPHFPPQR